MIVLTFISCFSLFYAFYRIRRTLLQNNTGTINIKVLLVHAVAITFFAISYTSEIIYTPQSGTKVYNLSNKARFIINILT